MSETNREINQKIREGFGRAPKPEEREDREAVVLEELETPALMARVEDLALDLSEGVGLLRERLDALAAEVREREEA